MIPFPSDPAQEETLPVEGLRSALEAMLVKKSMFQFDASTAVKRILEADQHGIPSHGVGRFPEYIESMDVGDIDPRARVLTLDNQPAFAVLDGSRAMGHVAATKAAELAVEKARESGIGFVALGNSQTLGAASVYVRLISEQGMIGWCMSSTGGATVAAPGTKAGAVGNTAFAYAIPVQDSHPVVFDSACGTESWGKLELLRRYGIPLPDGIAWDEKGSPAVDSLSAQVMKPAGELGFGLSLFASVLAGPLCGGRMPIHKTRPGSAEDSQHVFFALNLEKFVDVERFQKQLIKTLDAIRSLPAEDTPVRIPGDRGAMTYASSQEEITLHRGVVADLRALAEKLNVDMP